MRQHSMAPSTVLGVLICAFSSLATAQVAPEAYEAFRAGEGTVQAQSRSAVEVLRKQGFDVTPQPTKGTSKIVPNSVTGTAVSTRTAIVNQAVDFRGTASTLGIAENAAYLGSTDVCIRIARFDSPNSFNPTWRTPSQVGQNGVVEAYRVDTGQLFGIKTLDIEMSGHFTIAGGTPGLACSNDGCGTTYAFSFPDIIAALCEVWAGTDGTTFSRLGYCSQMDILPSVWNQGLRSKLDELPPYDGGAATGAFRSRNTVNAGLGTYYRIRFGFFTFGATTADYSRVCDSLLSVTHD